MAAEERQPGPSLKERLFREFYGFSFFKAVNLLETIAPEKKAIGQTLNPGEEPVRFGVKPGFTFPASDISNLTHDDKAVPPRMEVAFMGLIGPSGVLPHWYNQLAIERTREKDSSLAAFLDLFHHRLISLFYLAWKRYRFPENYIRGARDRLSGYLLSLIGLGTQGLSGKSGLPEESMIFYGGLLSRQTPSAVGIEATVAYFADARVTVDQFINRLIPLDPVDLTQVGSANSALGVNAVCGSHAWETQSKFRVNIGPMGFDKFVTFLPTSRLVRPIFALVKQMAGLEHEFDVRLFLKRDEVPLCTLGTPETPARLGWSTWIRTPGVMQQEDPYLTLQETDL
jgi:type VI secretion system protein ImpH